MSARPEHIIARDAFCLLLPATLIALVWGGRDWACALAVSGALSVLNLQALARSVRWMFQPDGNTALLPVFMLFKVGLFVAVLAWVASLWGFIPTLVGAHLGLFIITARTLSGLGLNTRPGES